MKPTLNSPEQRFVPTDHHGPRAAGQEAAHFRLHPLYEKADPADHDLLIAAYRDAGRPEESKRSYIREATAEEMLTIPPCLSCGRRHHTRP